MKESNPLFDDYKAAVELIDALIKTVLDDEASVFDMFADVTVALTEDGLPLVRRYEENNIVEAATPQFSDGLWLQESKGGEHGSN